MYLVVKAIESFGLTYLKLPFFLSQCRNKVQLSTTERAGTESFASKTSQVWFK